MSLTIVDRSGSLTDQLRVFAERRLSFALARFDDRVRRVSVVISDVNGPRGGVDKSCRIVVKLRGVDQVVVTDQDGDAAACIARAAERAGRTVSRAIERLQGFDRSTRRNTQEES